SGLRRAQTLTVCPRDVQSSNGSRLAEKRQQLFAQVFGALFGDPVGTALDHASADGLSEPLHGFDGQLAKATFATQGQHRHFEPGPGILGVVLRVGEDGAVVFESGAQGAWGGVAADILVYIFCADSRWIVRAPY